MTLSLFNKLTESNPNLSPEELRTLRESLGVNVYEELDTYIKAHSENLLDYCTILLHAAAHQKDGSEIDIVFEGTPIEAFVEQFKIFDLDAQKMINLVLKQELKRKRKNGSDTRNDDANTGSSGNAEPNNNKSAVPF